MARLRRVARAQFSICYLKIGPGNPLTSLFSILYSPFSYLPYPAPPAIREIILRVTRRAIRRITRKAIRGAIRRATRTAIRRTTREAILPAIRRATWQAIGRVIPGVVPGVARRFAQGTIRRAIRGAVGRATRRITRTAIRRASTPGPWLDLSIITAFLNVAETTQPASPARNRTVANIADVHQQPHIDQALLLRHSEPAFSLRAKRPQAATRTARAGPGSYLTMTTLRMVTV
jgi:hypothetical protein